MLHKQIWWCWRAFLTFPLTSKMKSEVCSNEFGVYSCNRDLREYLAGSKMQDQGTSELVDEFSDDLRKMHGRCLDLGCGPGRMTRDVILPKLPEDALLVGADESENVIEFAKKHCESEKRLSFLTMNIGKMRIPEAEIGKYNNIVSFYYLHTLQNIQRSARNLFRLLAPNGRALVMFLSHHDIFDLYLGYRSNPRYQEYMKDVFYKLPTLYGCPNAAEIVKNELVEIGLKEITCVHKEMSVTYDSLDDLERTLAVMDPFVHRMPDDVRKMYTKEMAEDFAKNKQKNGKIVDQYRVVIALFQK